RRRNSPCLEPGGAGIDGFPVELHHAFLAGVGVDAGEADGERGIAVGADPAQAVERGLAGLERHVVALPPPLVGGHAAPDSEGRDLAHCAATGAMAGAAVSARPPAASRAPWLTRPSRSMA